ncbi:flagellin [Thermomonas sp. XSG]|uniref:flagellin n=1 Tax=Thermomonas sp. XSG TaxID=2771436 RepID=UPI00168176C4|nr:flagellin [Thermomonas sp. XSG]QNU16362.1 flagellin [Thermomonas sp. XSG]
MSIINTNVMSLNSQRNLAANNASLGTTIQRLSSGMRINSAKDDAAGLAISERFTTQIRGLNQAARNANDGISLAQTAEGAMAEIGNNLQRIRELAVQSSNATNSSTDRDALQAEVTQLQAEIQRVASQTEFNGTKLLDGNFAGQAFQVGANAGQLITVDSIASAQTSALGNGNFAADVDGAALTAGTVSGLTINGKTIEDVTVTADAAGAAKLAAAINKRSGDTGVFAIVDGATVNLQALKADTDTVVGGTVANSGLTAATTAASAGTATQVEDLNISTFLGAQRAISIADKALTAVNSSRAELGAIQNRFSSVISNLNTTSENLSASRSRIRDTDFAKETAELTRSQILNQAGTAMLAQANQVPQSVLSLLR